MRKHWTTIALALLLIFGTWTRITNLSWGDGMFFHPDENNMARAITQLSWPHNLNPHFFAYGQLPLYLVYITYNLINLANHLPAIQTNALQAGLFASVPFPQAILLLRVYSAIWSVLTMWVVYQIAKLLFKSKPLQLLTLLFTACTPGLIQMAHFGTTESLLTLLFSLILLRSLELVQSRASSRRNLLLIITTSMLIGIAAGVKLTGLYFAAPFSLALLIRLRERKLQLIITGVVMIALIVGMYIVTSPYNLLEKNEFLGSMRYETGVATGAMKVFYTRQFEQTTPILFQFEKIFPHALGWPLFLLGNLGIGISFGQLVMRLIKKSKTTADTKILLTLFAFFSFFISNAILYAKWTRFVMPIFPLFAIFSAYFVQQMYSWIISLNNRFLVRLLITFYFALVTFQLFTALSFFTIYLRADSRAVASAWIFENIPNGSYILSETANVVDIPFVNQNSKIKIQNLPIPNYQVISFNFYELDNNPELPNELTNHLTKADYIFIPSRRIFTNHLRFPDKYPLLNNYYQTLFNERLGFELVKEISSFPNFQFSIFNFQLFDEAAEETFTVFDHPVIRIYKKFAKHDSLWYQQQLTAPL